ncbi:hypothetical protein N2152v2_003433 [Parachlorella kessleri]
MARDTGPGRQQRQLQAVLEQTVEEIERKRHKKNPFEQKYVQLCLSGPPQDGATIQAAETKGRAAVESAVTNVHVRVELIRTMRTMLVRETEQAVKHAALEARGRGGGGRRKGREVAGAAAADGPAAEGAAVGSFLREDVFERFEAFLKGDHQLDVAGIQAGGSAVRAAGLEGNPNHLARAQLCLSIEDQQLPLPFDEFLQQVLGDGVPGWESTTVDLVGDGGEHAARPATPGTHAAAGVEAAAALFKEHAEQLAQQGLLQDDVGIEACGSEELWGQLFGGQQPYCLPAYLAQPEGLKAGADWPEEIEVDDLEEVQPSAAARQHSSPLGRSNCQPHDRHGLEVLRGLPAGCGQVRTDASSDTVAGTNAPAAAEGHGLRSDLWDLPDGGFDPGDDAWAAFEQEGQPAWPLQGSQQQQQQQHQQPGLCRLQASLGAPEGHPGIRAGMQEGRKATDPPSRLAPRFAKRQPLQLSQAAHNREAGQPAPAGIIGQQPWAVELDEGEDIRHDEALVQVDCTEQQHSAAQAKAAAPRKQVPTFLRRTAKAQGQARAHAEPSIDEIEDAHSDDEISLAAGAGLHAPSQQAGARQVPAFGRRSEARWEEGGAAAAPAGAAAAAATVGAAQPLERQEGGIAAGGMGGGGCLVNMGGMSEAKNARGRKASGSKPGPKPGKTESHRAFVVDFSRVDMASLRPSVLFRGQAGSKPKWKPVHDAESLLIKPLSHKGQLLGSHRDQQQAPLLACGMTPMCLGVEQLSRGMLSKGWDLTAMREQLNSAQGLDISGWEDPPTASAAHNDPYGLAGLDLSELDDWGDMGAADDWVDSGEKGGPEPPGHGCSARGGSLVPPGSDSWQGVREKVSSPPGCGGLPEAAAGLPKAVRAAQQAFGLGAALSTLDPGHRRSAGEGYMLGSTMSPKSSLRPDNQHHSKDWVRSGGCEVLLEVIFEEPEAPESEHSGYVHGIEAGGPSPSSPCWTHARAAGKPWQQSGGRPAPSAGLGLCSDPVGEEPGYTAMREGDTALADEEDRVRLEVVFEAEDSLEQELPREAAAGCGPHDEGIEHMQHFARLGGGNRADGRVVPMTEGPSGHSSRPPAGAWQLSQMDPPLTLPATGLHGETAGQQGSPCTTEEPPASACAGLDVGCGGNPWEAADSCEVCWDDGEAEQAGADDEAQGTGGQQPWHGSIAPTPNGCASFDAWATAMGGGDISFNTGSPGAGHDSASGRVEVHTWESLACAAASAHRVKPGELQGLSNIGCPQAAKAGSAASGERCLEGWTTTAGASALAGLFGGSKPIAVPAGQQSHLQPERQQGQAATTDLWEENCDISWDSDIVDEPACIRQLRSPVQTAPATATETATPSASPSDLCPAGLPCEIVYDSETEPAGHQGQGMADRTAAAAVGWEEAAVGWEQLEGQGLPFFTAANGMDCTSACIDTDDGTAQGWECDVVYEDNEPDDTVLGGGLQAPLRAGCQATAAAGVRVQAGKRRLDHIGAEIIKALREERRSARLDMQPLMQQLAQQLGQALGSCRVQGAAGSASLSQLRRGCMGAQQGAGPAGAHQLVSVQRCFLALLTTVNQHNSHVSTGGRPAAQHADLGAATPAEASGAGAAEGSSARVVVPGLQQQLRLLSLAEGRDVQVLQA